MCKSREEEILESLKELREETTTSMTPDRTFWTGSNLRESTSGNKSLGLQISA